MGLGKLYIDFKRYLTYFGLRGLKEGSTRFNYSELKEKADRAKLELSDTHHKYINSISSESMAVSLEAASCLYALAELMRPASMIDYGSGYSSFVLRKYMKASGQNIKAISVDDNKEWLEKSRQYVAGHSLNTDGFELFDVKSINASNQFDLIFYDLNFVEERVKYVSQLLNQLSAKGVIVFDDVHKDYYFSELKSILKANNVNHFSLSELTKDRLGRFAIIAFR